MIDIHVHMSKSSDDASYFVSMEREIEHLLALGKGTSSVNRFVVFPHYSHSGYCNDAGNLSLLSLPPQFIPFFRFKLERGMRSEWFATRSCDMISRAKYLRAKLRMQPAGSELEAVLTLSRLHGVRGLKFHDGQDGTMDASSLSRLLQEDVVLVLHSYPAKLRQFLASGLLPPNSAIKAKLVFAHFGYSLVNPSREVPDILWLNEHAGDWLLFDTSFVGTLPLLRPLLAPCLRRLVFGSDFPAVSPDAALITLTAAGRLLSVAESPLMDQLERNSEHVSRILQLSP